MATQLRLWVPTVLTALLTACASQPNSSLPEQRSSAPSVVDAPRSARGNPPFYEVLGRRYFVLDSSVGYRERGVASWYGRDFHGLATASGETYNMYEMTAAHKTLPIPTWVEVTNLKNDRRVIVKINDRGPFVDERLIDLSFRAAEALDVVRDGTAPVEVRALGAPSVPPALVADTAPEAAPTAAERGSFALISPAAAATIDDDSALSQPMFIQVGAFAEHRNALGLVDRLKAQGYDDAFIVTDDAVRPPLHRVRVGPYRSAREYDRARGHLQSIGVGATQLVVGR